MMSRRPQRIPREGVARHAAHAPQTLLHHSPSAQAAGQDPHCVLLYRDAAHLEPAIGGWAEAGLRAGEGVVLVVREATAEGVRSWLRQAGLDPAGFEAVGRLRILDADRTLSLFMVHGAPQANLFANAVTPLIEDARKASPAGEVRAWGEMVDLLWKRAQGPAAVALEELWNGLIAQKGFRLFCAYQVDAFDALQFPKVRAIAASHGLLLPVDDGPRFEAAVEAALEETYGPEAAAVRAVLGTGAGPRMPLSLHRLLTLHELAPEFAALVAARAGLRYDGRGPA
ncbi:MAG TPA: MEDS domain-containing protein [Candidatus Thermoplasmatota archaeon]|nr:MEDS domain-containing protein [Candidatus Thermoplasmatota archaeon]